MYASDGLNGKIGCLGKPLFQNPVVEGQTVICILVAQVLDRTVLIERLERLGRGVGRLGVALLKANGVVLAGQRRIKLRIGIGLGGKLILGNRKVAPLSSCIKAVLYSPMVSSVANVTARFFWSPSSTSCAAESVWVITVLPARSSQLLMPASFLTTSTCSLSMYGSENV